MRLLKTRESQSEGHPLRQSDLQERSVVSVRATGFRLTLWTDAALLAVIGAPGAGPRAPWPRRTGPRGSQLPPSTMTR